jgi:hypothetical protein
VAPDRALLEELENILDFDAALAKRDRRMMPFEVIRRSRTA